MAPANKPTVVHVAVIVPVMATVIFGAMWYIEMDKRITAQAEKATAKSEAATLERVANDRYDDIKAMKQLYGTDLEEVGLDSGEDTNTVLGVMREDIKTYAKAHAKETVRKVLAELSAHITTLTKNRDSVQVDLEDAKRQITKLKSEFQSREDAYSNRTDAAEAELKALIALKQEIVDGLNEKNAKADRDLREEQNKSATSLQGKEDEIAELKTDYDNLEGANDRLQDSIDESTRRSFEVPDGLIRWVDHATNLVWIDLGEADQLPKRTSFSVYVQSNNGVARGPEDIKGAIEVTRIISAHLAEARLTQGDNLRPIAPGDPIYSPLWSPGKREYFAFVGLIDFDDDGRTDRPRLESLVSNANAIIETVVDDTGKMTGPGITERTRFLVVGQIPNLDGAKPNDIENINTIMEHHQNLRKAARQQGVRVINLGDFLNYTGYTSTRRLWVPGDPYPFKLKAGAKSLGIDETVSGRESSGRTSGVYGPRKGLRQPESSGQTSKAFGSGR